MGTGDIDRVRNMWLLAHSIAQLGGKIFFSYYENPEYDIMYMFCNSQMPLSEEWRWE